MKLNQIGVKNIIKTEYNFTYILRIIPLYDNGAKIQGALFQSKIFETILEFNINLDNIIIGMYNILDLINIMLPKAIKY